MSLVAPESLDLTAEDVSRLAIGTSTWHGQLGRLAISFAGAWSPNNPGGSLFVASLETGIVVGAALNWQLCFGVTRLNILGAVLWVANLGCVQLCVGRWTLRGRELAAVFG